MASLAGLWEDAAQWYGTIESNPYQQGWFVPQDVDGMVAANGWYSNKQVIADLEHFFEKTPENMMWNDYYNHANEPVHHVPFLFNSLGQTMAHTAMDKSYMRSGLIMIRLKVW
jgi:putative alpha-1,2-mannosidase